MQLWSGVLAAVPGSRLLLKTRPPLEDGVHQLTAGRFAAHGITADRIEMRGGCESIRDHLASYADIDLGLDPFPYHGTTTTCEALWMGVPVVSLAGKSHPSRVGVSLLHAVGREDFIAQTPAQFIEIASRHASDLSRLAALRAGLRDRMRASPLCDEVRFTRGFEAALQEIWRKWCAS